MTNNETVLDFLTQHPDSAVKDISTGTDLDPKAVSNVVYTLKKKKLIRGEGGTWSVTTAGAAALEDVPKEEEGAGAKPSAPTAVKRGPGRPKKVKEGEESAPVTKRIRRTKEQMRLDAQKEDKTEQFQALALVLGVDVGTLMNNAYGLLVRSLQSSAASTPPPSE
jgi:DNA-binding MarR family transcriptional regulator